MRSRGFTLLEMLVVVAVIGVTAIALSPVWSNMQAQRTAAYNEKQKLFNLSLKAALEGFAAGTTLGRLPVPFTGSGRTLTIYNVADSSADGVALVTAIGKTSLDPNEVNDDGSAARNVRVYQLVQGLTTTMPLEYRSGPAVTLTYDYGAIYMTQCPAVDTLCNPTPATGVPGSSVALTAANYTTWTTTGTDSAPAFVSSLPTQEAMLTTTATRLNRVRDALLSYVRGQQVTASAGVETNWYPNQDGASAAGNLAGATPGTNQGCRDGWYDLSPAGSPAILSAAGLAAAEFGVTAWGGVVQYCRDFDPLGTGGADAAPHYGALRILSNVSAGGQPDAAVQGNNVVLTFGG